MRFEFDVDFQRFIFGIAWSDEDDEVYPSTMMLALGPFMLFIGWGDE